MIIYFASNNEYKSKELLDIINPELPEAMEIRPIKIKIEEIQSSSAEKIVREKVLRAFPKVRRPFFVAHTGLYSEYFGGLPGGLTKIIWESLQADKFCEVFGKRPNTNAVAKTILGYCDGKFVRTFEGSVKGKITAEPRGDRSFQWDCVFIPDGFDKTFAELGDFKYEISSRRLALQALVKYLKENRYEGFN
ncbi:MAG: non-canonical purine pyrophosphatase [Firmicutes bacterium]|nr:non-canonical purine pyrophosphatase [Bacillota bacterium]